MWRGPRHLAAPGPVLPCADPEPRAPRVIPYGPISPSGPPPAEDLPSAAAVNPRVWSLERGVLPPRGVFSNTHSITWRRITGKSGTRRATHQQTQRHESGTTAAVSAAGSGTSGPADSSGSERSERARGVPDLW